MNRASLLKTTRALGLIALAGLALAGCGRRGDLEPPPGAPRAAAQLFDSNRFMLASLLRRLGCDVSDLGILRDDRAAFAAAVAEQQAAQQRLNEANGRVEQAKQTVANIEATLDQASSELDAAAQAQQEAETAYQKSNSLVEAIARARELSSTQPQSVPVEGDPANADGAQPVPVHDPDGNLVGEAA